MQDEARVPSAIWFTVNRSCNNRCQWCYAEESNFNEKDEMSLEIVESLAKMCEELAIKHVSLIGGETTMYSKICEAISLLTKCGISANIISNGRIFHDPIYTKKLIDAGMRSATISLKAINQADYMCYTGVDGYNEVIDGLEILKNHNVDVHLAITIPKSMMDNPSLIIDGLKKFKDYVIYIEFVNPSISNGIVSMTEAPSPTEIAAFCLDMQPLLKKSRIKYFYNLGIPICLLEKNLFKELYRGKRMMTTCHVRSGFGAIFLQNGDVIPCHQFMNNTLGEYGKDYSSAKEFKSFWNSVAVNDFLDAANFYPTQKCSKCNKWAICGGGCQIKWFGFNPEEFISLGKENGNEKSGDDVH